MDGNQHSPSNQPGNAKKYLLVTFLGVLLAAAVGSGVWYWQQQTINQQSTQINALESQVETLSSEKEQLATANEERGSQENEPEKQTEYRAEVGQFTLTVPSKYRVIQRSDGPGEGGPFTRILIAEETDTPGVYESSIWDKLVISANPMEATNSSFASKVESRLSNDRVLEEKKTTIDGVEAEVYLVGGISTMKKIYFVHNDIFYEIDMNANTDAANERLEVIKNGFQFSG